MASFRTHVSFGIAFGVLGAFSLVGLSTAPEPWSFFCASLFLVSVGAILPDMDSDSGLPFHVTFGSLALIAGGIAFLLASRLAPGEYGTIAIASVLSAAGVWGGVGSLFKRFTRHRGMAHSIPAALFSGLVVFSVTNRFDVSSWDGFLLGVSVSAGYLLHLILDEAYAAINFHGKLFVPNRSLGSALKFFSRSRPINVLLYGSILFLWFGNAEVFRTFALRLFELFLDRE